jgi:AraC-like DNA-binding protein
VALSQFYQQFRTAYGITPREMRANYLHQQQ